MPERTENEYSRPMKLYGCLRQRIAKQQDGQGPGGAAIQSNWWEGGEIYMAIELNRL